MKINIKKLLPFLLVVSLTESCKKELEEYNPSGATVESLFKTPEGFESAVNATYTYNRNLYGKEEGYAMLEMGTDIWTNAAFNGSTGINGIFPQTPLTTYQGLISDNLWVNTKMWQPCYSAINLCNTGLKYIDNAGLNAARKPVLEAEMRFMRAWYYYHLVETFGDIHFTLEPTEGMVTTANRTSVETIYKQIFEDVESAVANLPVTTNDYGRITKPAAEAFLAKLYLTRGRNQEASDYAKKVITGYNFKLLTNYADLWNINNQKNAEVLWAVNYSTNLANNAGSNLGHSLFLMEYNTLPGMLRDVANGFPNVRYMPTRSLIQMFDDQNDARYNASFKSVWYANEPDASKRPAGMNVGDTAIFVSKNVISAAERTSKKYKVYDINDVYDANGLPKDRFHFLSLKKFDDPTRGSATETQSSRDAFILRLADMYLVAAEAQFKLGKLDSAAYFVNEVRKRAALPGKQAAMQIAPADVNMDFILDERAREFAGEQMRWYDLKRAGKLVERVKKYNPDAAVNIKDFHILRPIPQAQLDAVTNKSEFKQNQGY
ncbi:RagB/SusD family nutrient uptake outer membrane protein [Chitinophagaceae bacterium LB-8]|uniref:RagB/SusD family nutrient uptake outer membrane protein n=1 Tax=Paraflavisolibacter caeni TaxID=2982496 RepID=A0A9X2Y031_9BACT|nr:RagB/SusD family nutrient uptake outer membrane protein [Paraflavisolibacter caeni]MCU7551897.1 RagB/SusD family nutrient uptake outer membrane protein [Paraflavisolibacter caeni]